MVLLNQYPSYIFLLILVQFPVNAKSIYSINTLVPGVV